MGNRDLTKLQDEIGYTFQNKELIMKALRHSSYINENNLKRIDCNERIEFLGDAILELICSEFLYGKYPEASEGRLTKMRARLVCESSLAYAASQFHLGDNIQLGKGEERSGGRKRESIISDACEALIGAIYLDGGIEPARAFVLNKILGFLVDKQLYIDHKTELQELVQKKQEIMPKYIIIDEQGPQHEKTYVARVYVGERVMGEGCGRSKKQAEQEAAKNALKNTGYTAGERCI